VGVVGQRLGVGEKKILAMTALERDAVAQRSDVMAEMQRSGRAVAGEDDGTIGVRRRERGHGVSSNGAAACVRRLEMTVPANDGGVGRCVMTTSRSLTGAPPDGAGEGCEQDRHRPANS